MINYMTEHIYSVSQFAKRINCTRGVVLRLIRDGRILSFRLSDAVKSPHRIKESEIDRLISWQLHKTLNKEII